MSVLFDNCRTVLCDYGWGNFSPHLVISHYPENNLEDLVSLFPNSCAVFNHWMDLVDQKAQTFFEASVCLKDSVFEDFFSRIEEFCDYKYYLRSFSCHPDFLKTIGQSLFALIRRGPLIQSFCPILGSNFLSYSLTAFYLYLGWFWLSHSMEELMVEFDKAWSIFETIIR